MLPIIIKYRYKVQALQRWVDEGPSDHRVEIWEEWWDDRLQEESERGKETLGSRVVKADQEDQDSHEEEEENGNDRYKTYYIEWEAKEVIDLVSSSEDLG